MVHLGVLVLLSFPPGLGMILAFFAAKKEAEGKRGFKGVSLSGGLIYGFMAGVLTCFFSAVVLLIGVLLLESDPIESLIVIAGYAMCFIFIATMFIGVIFFIPCALFGYNIGARKRAEAEMGKSHQELLKEIEAEKRTDAKKADN
ncbi:MAG: hypothetical protein ACI9E1_002296 [Cryomorphaceae bacterium]|jgi:hypothetical protein